MLETVIRVDKLGKKYVLGHKKEDYTTLRDAISNTTKNLFKPFQKSKSESRKSNDEFWALNDVSFEIKQGERVGIVGRNGAGKSTLLKILSRITEPTYGSISIQGRIASLLEVGTGFHPELTGRENIYLNGAILGMSKLEIQHKFDEIVAFAEVEKFLDTPVKRYSSGMYVRLAFAVAAHLEPEILIVDEVLAVGDVQFQNKCLGKMQDVAHGGRTVLFVSHNMAAIRQLCSSALLMQQGKLTFAGTSEEVIDRYLNSISTHSSLTNQLSRYGIELLEIMLQDLEGVTTESPVFNRNYTLKLIFKAAQPLTETAIVLRIYDAKGTLVSSICSLEEGITPFILKSVTEVTFNLFSLQLMPGQYHISVFIYRPNDPIAYLEAENISTFEVHPAIVHEAMWAYRSDHGIVRICQSANLIYR